MNIDANTLKKQYLNWVNKSFSYEQLNNNIIRIDTPFLDNFSDEVVIYAIPKPNNFIKLTDDGWTIDNLESQGIYIHRSQKRKRLLETQLKMYGVNLNNDELTISIDITDFPIAKHRLLQAILFVNDMFMLSNNNTKNIFIEDMDKYFFDNNIRVLKNASFVGESGLTHKFDYSIPGLGKKIPDKLIKILSGGNNDVFAKAIVTDVEQTKAELNGKNTVFYTFINDQKNDKKIEIRNDILNLFNNSNIHPVLYSDRENVVEEFKQ